MDAVVAVPEVPAGVVDVPTGPPEVARTEVAAVVDVVVMIVVDGLPYVAGEDCTGEDWPVSVSGFVASVVRP